VKVFASGIRHIHRLFEKGGLAEETATAIIEAVEKGQISPV
jgi:hypothetical protein